MNEIKAIETIYKGFRFRSRLEARYAVFFDALNVDWEYEKEGYDLGDGIHYLPDFWIPLDKEFFPGWGFWVEIKPAEPSEAERTKLELLAVGTGHTTVCFWGSVWSRDCGATVYKHSLPDHGKFPRPYITSGKIWFNQLDELRVGIFDQKSNRYHHLPFPYWVGLNPDRVQDAFAASKYARFEFGESGITGRH